MALSHGLNEVTSGKQVEKWQAPKLLNWESQGEVREIRGEAKIRLSESQEREIPRWEVVDKEKLGKNEIRWGQNQYIKFNKREVAGNYGGVLEEEGRPCWVEKRV